MWGTRIAAALIALALVSSGGDAEARKRRRVNVELVNAELRSALQLLADAAHVGLVVDSDVGGSVSVKLRDVDALQALEVVANARGALVRMEGQVAVVTKR